MPTQQDAERAELIVDTELAAGFLRRTLETAETVSSIARAALGMSICSLLTDHACAQHAAAGASRQLAEAVLRAAPRDLICGDQTALVLGCVLAGGTALEATAALRQAFSVRSELSTCGDVRGHICASLLGIAERAMPLYVSDAMLDVLMGKDEGAVRDVCDGIAAWGLAPTSAVRRRALGHALGAHACVAFRGKLRPEAATYALRAIAAERLDRQHLRDGIRILRRQQRSDGAYGHLPLRAPNGTDLRFMFHLPVTVMCLWTLHDVVRPTCLLRYAFRAASTAYD